MIAHEYLTQYGMIIRHVAKSKVFAISKSNRTYPE